MKIQYSDTILTDIEGRGIFLDATTLINASRSEEFRELLKQIRQKCVFWTIPSAVYEYTRTANTLSGYSDRLGFVTEMGITVFNRVEEILEKDKELNVFLAAYSSCFKKVKSGPSYTDSILCAMMYKHRKSKALLLSSNHKDIPSGIFDRVELITIDIEGDLYTEAIYSFSESKYSRRLEILDKEQ